jgi:protein O-mannosyl-transferase
MRRELVLVFVAAVGLYLPTARYGVVQDDRAIIASNPAAHSIGAALAAFADPYWPRETGAGLYRPVTIMSYAVDWTVSGGRPGWLHIMNALWHGLATVLLVMLLARWLPPLGAVAAGLVFAWHPVHVEAVASLVGRAELLAAVGILGAVLAARRGHWAVAVLCAALAMFSKEHGVIVGVVILLDRWLSFGRGGTDDRGYPAGLWVALGIVTIGFLAAWFAIGWAGESDAAAVFYERGTWARLAIALPAALRAAVLLIWPASLSVDYNPQVLPARVGMSLPALLGFVVIVGIPALVVWCRRRAPAIAFAAGIAALSCLPTANLFFSAGVILAERNLYLAVILPAVFVGWSATWLAARRGLRPAAVAVAVVAVACGSRAFARLPAWQDNRSQLLTLLADHPESYRAHASAAAVLAGTGDTAGARREYRRADSLFPGDRYLNGANAIFLIGIGDTAAAVPLIDRGRRSRAGERMTLRAEFLLELARGHRTEAAAIADSASRRFAGEQKWYLQFHQ